MVPIRLPRAMLARAASFVPQIVKMMGGGKDAAALATIGKVLATFQAADGFKLVLTGKTIGKVALTGEIVD